MCRSERTKAKDEMTQNFLYLTATPASTKIDAKG
jgi:hypothetical protein